MTPIPQAAAWFVSAVLVMAAIIDGRELRVPNWLTFPLAIAGLVFATAIGGAGGLLWGLAGLALGLALLLPLHAIGGMGAGDVKLLAAVGAWVGPATTLGAFVVTGLVGGLMAAAMIVASGSHRRHTAQFAAITREIVTIHDPVKLSEIAAARKPSMRLLPYGIPLAVGSIAYFAYLGLLGSF